VRARVAGSGGRPSGGARWGRWSGGGTPGAWGGAAVVMRAGAEEQAKALPAGTMRRLTVRGRRRDGYPNERTINLHES